MTWSLTCGNSWGRSSRRRWVTFPAAGKVTHSRPCTRPAWAPGATASLIVRLGTGQASVALASRRVPIEPVNARLVRPAA
jgi:hypothetical protein